MQENTDDTTDAPTVSEFIPADDVPEPNRTGKPMVRILQATGDGGLELAAHEPYDDTVENHVYVCDVCGKEEFLESDMAAHANLQHTED